MGSLFYLGGVITLIVVYPYIRCFWKRLFCSFKVKSFCKKRNYSLHRTHPLWFLGSKYDRVCDFYIETSDEVYAVKLFSVMRRTSMLIFREEGSYFYRRFVGVLWIPFWWNTKLRPLIGYSFRYKYKAEWIGKTPHNILLVNPISMDIFRQAKNGYEDAVGLGDEIFGMKIYSLSRFLETIKN